MFSIRCYIFLHALLCFIFVGNVRAQTEYAIDTAFHTDASCTERFYPYWYIKTKRPESSKQLAKAADAVIPVSARDTAQNGFINFQFIVDCKSVVSGYQLSQTDPNHQPAVYPPALVDALYYFIKGLNGWKPAVYEQQPAYYKAYLAFKIKNGHVVEVAP